MNKNVSSIITLITDFGYKDPFIAEMKGVILSIEAAATIIDITHDIEPFNIIEAAFVVGSSSKYFPPGTIHIVVVDPGVGSRRRAVILETGNGFYVGPDNGVFSEVIRAERQIRCFHITNEAIVISAESPTFQGRDVFAPVAARLMQGIPPTDAGPEISDPVLIEIPTPYMIDQDIVGEIVYVDRFGNAITNITTEHLQRFGKNYKAQLKGSDIEPVNHYAQASPDTLRCLLNSSGRLEIFVFRGNAAGLVGLEKGDSVRVLR